MQFPKPDLSRPQEAVFTTCLEEVGQADKVLPEVCHAILMDRLGSALQYYSASRPQSAFSILLKTAEKYAAPLENFRRPFPWGEGAGADSRSFRESTETGSGGERECFDRPQGEPEKRLSRAFGARLARMLGEPEAHRFWNSFPMRYLRSIEGPGEEPQAPGAAGPGSGEVAGAPGNVQAPSAPQSGALHLAAGIFEHALWLKRDGQWRQAKILLEALMEEDGDLEIQGPSAFHLGEINIWQGHYGSALKWMRCAVRLREDNGMAWVYLALLYRVVPVGSLSRTPGLRPPARREGPDWKPKTLCHRVDVEELSQVTP